MPSSHGLPLRGTAQQLSRSLLDPTTAQGRLHLARATLLAMAGTFLFSGFYGANVAAALSVALPCLTLLAASFWLGFRPWLLLCLACFVVANTLEVFAALSHHRLPQGISLWSPLVLLEAPLLLNAETGLYAAGLWALGAVLAFCLHVPAAAALPSWLSFFSSSALFALLGYGISRFLSLLQRDQATTRHALSSAQYDALTQVLGRAATEQELSLGVERAQAQKVAFSLIVCDIDHFKKVNDQYGHNKGDEVLRAVALRLRQNALPIGATVGRWGGEEFVIMLPRYSREDAMNVAEQIRQDLEKSEVAGLQVTLSLGVAAYRRGEEVNTLFERADQATYEAKREGRNRVRG